MDILTSATSTLASSTVTPELAVAVREATSLLPPSHLMTPVPVEAFPAMSLPSNCSRTGHLPKASLSLLAAATGSTAASPVSTTGRQRRTGRRPYQKTTKGSQPAHGRRPVPGQCTLAKGNRQGISEFLGGLTKAKAEKKLSRAACQQDGEQLRLLSDGFQVDL